MSEEEWKVSVYFFVVWGVFMKKELCIVGGIVIFIVIAHLWSQWYAKRFFNEITEGVSNIEVKIFENNFINGELEKDIDEVINKWKDKYNLFACFLEHEELEKVEGQFIAISANIMVGDYDKVVDEIERCRFILRHIEEKDSLRVVNVF